MTGRVTSKFELDRSEPRHRMKWNRKESAAILLRTAFRMDSERCGVGEHVLALEKSDAF